MGTFFAILLAGLGLATPYSQPLQLANLLAFLIFIPAAVFKSSKVLAIGALVVVMTQVFVTSFFEGGNIRRELDNKLTETYTTDQRAFLKTYQLMEEGVNFYPALSRAMGNIMKADFKVDIGGWRQPFLFYLWKLLPGTAGNIYLLWVFVTSITLTAAFFVAYKYFKNNYALLSPLLLFPYYHFSLVDLTFLQMEWWATSAFIIGLALFVWRKYFAAGVLFAVSLASRELLIVPAGLIVFLLIFSKDRRKIKTIAIPILIFLSYYLFIHLSSIAKFGASSIRGYGNGSLLPFQATLAYSSWNYLFWPIRPFLLLLFLTPVFFLVKLMQKGSSLYLFFILSSFLPFAVVTMILSFIGGIDVWHDYWGIYFIPLLLISSPVFIIPPGK